MAPLRLMMPRKRLNSSLRSVEMLLPLPCNCHFFSDVSRLNPLTKKSAIVRNSRSFYGRATQCRSETLTIPGFRAPQNGFFNSPSKNKSHITLPPWSRLLSHTRTRLPRRETTNSYLILPMSNYSTRRTKKTSRSSTHSIQDLPSSRKGLSSQTAAHQAVYSADHSAIVDVSPSDKVMSPPPPLSLLTMNSILRGIVISTVSSSPLLLPPSLKIMSVLAHSNSPILNPDRNPVLRWLLKHTFYAQFCAGENATEVRKTVQGLKAMGCKGVMICYAKEAVLDDNDGRMVVAGGKTNSEAMEQAEILPWKNGTMETVSMTAPGDFVALKFTGAGSKALQDLAQGALPSPSLHNAITAICDLAAARGVRLLFDAEQARLQPGVDIWTVEYMRQYNTHSAIIYSTYQAYLKRCPDVLSSHLAVCRKEGFVLGVKLVRGAYLASDPRELICDTKTDTDEQYDGIAESVMRREYNSTLRPAAGEESQPFPHVSLVLAGHNLDSARKAMKIRNAQVERCEDRIPMEYAQLQGMADEVSCELVQKCQEAEKEMGTRDAPKVYKYLVWGTTGECMKYLLRRAQENKEAVGRTREGRDALTGELFRRMLGVIMHK